MRKYLVAILLCLAFTALSAPAHAYQTTDKNGVAYDWYYATSITPYTNMPTAVDLTFDAPPVGNQDPNNQGYGSCAAWAAEEDHYWLSAYDYNDFEGSGFAPMYTYTRLNGGAINAGTNPGDNLSFFVNQGTYPISSYPIASGNGATWNAKYLYNQIPSKASNFKTADYGWINNNNGGKFQNEIRELIEYNYPVILIIPHYNDIANATLQNNYLITTSVGTGPSHSVLASKYDANGVWFQNTYGTAYGKSGWAELSWNYLAYYVTDTYWAWDGKGGDIFVQLGQGTSTPAAAPAPAAQVGRGVSDDGVTSAPPADQGRPGDPRFGGRDLRPDQTTAANTFVVGPPPGPRPPIPGHSQP